MKSRFRKLIAAANEAIHPKIGMVCASNELVDLGQGWYQIPYGEYPHKEGLQILARTDADELVVTFNEMRSSDPTWKAAVYIGHPDHPDKSVRSDYPDSAAYGWIDQVAANEAGFRFRVDWNPEGQKLIDNSSYRYFSPLFWLKAASNVGRKVLHPKIFQSIGLTNTPNMGGCWLANEEQGDSMNLLERLKALINKDDIQSEDDVVNIFQKMVDALTRLRQAQEDKWEIENVAYDVAANDDVINNAVKLIAGSDALIAAANDAVPEAATTQITGLTTQVETLTADLEAANGLVVAANEGAAGAFVDLAIAQGKVKPADKAAQIAALVEADDLVAAGNTLLSGEPVIKTAPKAVDLKVIDMSAGQKRDAQLAAAANVATEFPGLNPVQVWTKLKSMPEHAALFEVSSKAE